LRDGDIPPERLNSRERHLSFDHLGGDGEDRLGHGQAELRRYLEIDGQDEFGWPFMPQASTWCIATAVSVPVRPTAERKRGDLSSSPIL
jgi:hypothetical protein